MLFCSMTFLYVFLPIVLSVYLMIRRDLRNYVLLIASIVFYAWGEPAYLAIMLLTIISNYIFAICIEKMTIGGGKRLLFLITAISVDLAVLGYFKYFNFLIENLNLLFKTNADFVKVLLPIGISFYTFQAISYLVDVYRGDVAAQKDPYKLALYIVLFPQLIAGPIVKYHDVADQIENRHITFNSISYGAKRFVIGLSKKMLIANQMGSIADSIFSQQAASFPTEIAWIGAICYSLQLFFDFSGYSDMAIGLGYIFGFKFKENFNYPYISKSITEFWRRWHISLSTWFREYLYIPLGGNRKGEFRTYLNLGLVFIATGLWHGAAWTFVVWGLWNGLFIIAERYFGLNKYSTTNKWKNLSLHIYCCLIFIVGWVIFRAPDLHYAVTYIQNMFGLIERNEGLYKIWYYIDTIQIVALIAAIVCCLPTFKNILEYSEKNRVLLWCVNGMLYIMFLLSTAEIASSTYNPFIYFRF